MKIHFEKIGKNQYLFLDGFEGYFSVPKNPGIIVGLTVEAVHYNDEERRWEITFNDPAPGVVEKDGPKVTRLVKI